MPNASTWSTKKPNSASARAFPEGLAVNWRDEIEPIWGPGYNVIDDRVLFAAIELRRTPEQRAQLRLSVARFDDQRLRHRPCCCEELCQVPTLQLAHDRSVRTPDDRHRSGVRTRVAVHKELPAWRGLNVVVPFLRR